MSRPKFDGSGRLTDAVLDEVREWQHRALDRMRGVSLGASTPQIVLAEGENDMPSAPSDAPETWTIIAPARRFPDLERVARAFGLSPTSVPDEPELTHPFDLSGGPRP